jgi:hypothetical protein
MSMPLVDTNCCATEPRHQCRRIRKLPRLPNQMLVPLASPLTTPRLPLIRLANHDAAADMVGAESTCYLPPLTRPPSDTQPLSITIPIELLNRSPPGHAQLEEKKAYAFG